MVDETETKQAESEQSASRTSGSEALDAFADKLDEFEASLTMEELALFCDAVEAARKQRERADEVSGFNSDQISPRVGDDPAGRALSVGAFRVLGLSALCRGCGKPLANCRCMIVGWSP